MKVSVHFKHIPAHTKIEKLAQEKALKLDKFELKPSEIQFHFTAKQHLYVCQVFVRGPHLQLQASSEEKDLLSGLELALERLEKQMAKWKSKTQNHRNPHKTHTALLGRMSKGLEIKSVSKARSRKSSRAA